MPEEHGTKKGMIRAMELLEVHNVSKHYKNFSLENIDFVLPKGYIMGYVGQNGAGKSTTLNIITNLCKSSVGEVRVNGITCMEDTVQYKESIGYIGGDFYYPNNFTVRNIRGILKNFYSTFSVEQFNELLHQWKLSDKMKVKDFSQGMKVKLMFAAVLARDTKLMVLDEATNGLDPVVRLEILKLLQEYIADGERSVIFSTHILSDLEQIADYIFFIHDGKKVLYDAKDELLESYLLVKGERRAITPQLQKALVGIMDNAYGFEAILPSDRADLLNHDFHFEKPTIDEIVIHYIKDKEKNG